MKKYLWVSIIYWPLAIWATIWLANSGSAIILNPAGAGLYKQHIGFPISQCYYGSFANDMDNVGIAGPCSDLAPVGYNIMINTGIAVLIFLGIVLGIKFSLRRSRPSSQINKETNTTPT
jgi:hypothetical protein